MHDGPGPSSSKYIQQRLSESSEVNSDDSDSAKVYNNHIGLTDYKMDPVMNMSTFRHRGYKVATVGMLPDDEEMYHKHRGHAQNKNLNLKGRFTGSKGIHYWDPDTDGKDAPKQIRDLNLP